MIQNNRSIITCLAVSAILSIACARDQHDRTVSASDGYAGPAKPKTIEELRKAVQQVLTKSSVPGAGIALVAKDEIIWAGGAGKADVMDKKDVTADTLFRVGSISKSFVALALLKLQEQGKIDLNAKLREVAPEIHVSNRWEKTHPVRIVNLLEHTAGFDSMHANEYYNTTDPPDIPLREVFAKFPKPQEVRWPPGTCPAYSNAGYAVAGYVIEKVTGRPFEDYIQDAILTPLGMTTSSFRLTEASRTRLAQGYEGAPPRPVPVRNMYLRPAGSLVSSPVEMARFLQIMLNRGRLGDFRLVSPQSIGRMEIPETTLASRVGLKNGYGLGIEADLEHAIKCYTHNGGFAGYVGRYCYIPEQDLGFAILLNKHMAWNVMEDAAKLVVGYLIADVSAPKQPSVHLSEAQLQPLSGYYEPTNPEFQSFAFLGLLLGCERVFVENGRLYRTGFFGKKEALIPVSDSQFRLEKEPEASMVFTLGEDGTPVLTGAHFYCKRKVSTWWPPMRLAMVLGGLLVMLSSPLFALVWVPRKVLGRMRGVRHLAVRIVPLFATLSFVGSVVAFLQVVESINPGERAGASVVFWAGTWAFAALSALGMALVLRSFRYKMNNWVRIHSLSISIACCGIAAYLGYWHMIGLKFWAY
jgi:CubicO group peptidase (beta-lactamase class C family)